MLRQLETRKEKIPSPSRECMMDMFSKAWDGTCALINPPEVFMFNMITLPLDGKKNVHANNKLWDLVGEDMEEFRKQL